MGLDFDDVADELYGLAPAEFTPARDARVAEARTAGDRELAAAIKGLKRPAMSAWLVNMLVRRAPEQIEELLVLGADLRDAQERLAGDDLRRLSQLRRRLVATLSRSAGAIAGELGQHMSGATERELETTLETALADPGAGDVIRRGRLIAALEAVGLGSLDALGVESPAPPKKPRPARARNGVDPAPDDADVPDEAAARREAAQLARTDAQRAAVAARIEAGDWADRLRAAREEHARALRAANELATQLEQRRGEAAQAAKRLQEAESASRAADRAAQAAERRADHLAKLAD